MSTYARFTLILAATLGLGACAADSEAPGDQARVLVWPAPAHSDVVVNTDEPGAPVLGPDVEALEIPIELESEGPNVCACAGQRCVSQWIQANFGCDICVHVDCAGTGIGGCVRCPLNPVLSAGTARPLAGDPPAYHAVFQAE